MSRPSSGWADWVAVTVLALGPADAALAYCRTAACEDGVGARCEPAQASDCGKPIAWPSSCVGYVLQEDASSQIDLESVRPLVKQAFDAWVLADCGSGEPGVTAEDLGDVACSEIGYDPETKNANIIIFRDDSWPYGGNATLALTTVTYAVDSGEIRDADLEINSDQVTFSTSDDSVNVDFLSIMTHEAGHFLGLAHSPTPGATMVVEYPPESITLRTLEADDVAGICAIYPPGNPATCESTPVNGLGDDCAEPAEVEADGCSCNSARSSSALPLGGALVALAATVRRARRRRPNADESVRRKRAQPR